MQQCLLLRSGTRGALAARRLAACRHSQRLSRHGVACMATTPSPPMAQPTATTSSSSQHPTTSFHHGITYVTYEGNSMAVKFNNTGVRVLVDPWLVEDLVFFGQDWLYRGKKRVLNTSKGGSINVQQIVEETDVVVLTQFLDDHCHLPTLRAFPRDIPIVANPEAAERIKPLGFTNVQVVDHGETVVVANGQLRITAAKGAEVGPPWSKRQNVYAMREVSATDGASASLYLDPHCDFVASSVEQLGKVDVVVCPVRSVLLGVPGLGTALPTFPVVCGDINLIKLLKILQPKVLVPLMNADIVSEGPINVAIFERGNVDAVQQQLSSAGLPTRLEMPAPPGESLAVAL